MNHASSAAESRRISSCRVWIAVAAVGLLTLALLLPFFFYYDLSFVHPHRFENHLPMLVPETTRLQWRDFVMPFQEFASGEYRARFLPYAINLKLRLAFYQFGVLPPALSLSWILQALAAYSVRSKVTA